MGSVKRHDTTSNLSYTSKVLFPIRKAKVDRPWRGYKSNIRVSSPIQIAWTGRFYLFVPFSLWILFKASISSWSSFKNLLFSSILLGVIDFANTAFPRLTAFTNQQGSGRERNDSITVIIQQNCSNSNIVLLGNSDDGFLFE